jgi:hypothetical protein
MNSDHKACGPGVTRKALTSENLLDVMSCSCLDFG